MADNRKVIRIKWVSEVQNDAGRRALLALSYPVFLGYAIAVSILKASLLCPLLVFLVAARNILRCARILTYSARLRWRKPKPRGADDWVVLAVDAYVDRIDGATP